MTYYKSLINSSLDGDGNDALFDDDDIWLIDQLFDCVMVLVII